MSSQSPMWSCMELVRSGCMQGARLGSAVWFGVVWGVEMRRPPWVFLHQDHVAEYKGQKGGAACHLGALLPSTAMDCSSVMPLPRHPALESVNYDPNPLQTAS